MRIRKRLKRRPKPDFQITFVEDTAPVFPTLQQWHAYALDTLDSNVFPALTVEEIRRFTELFARDMEKNLINEMKRRAKPRPKLCLEYKGPIVPWPSK